MKDFTKTLPIHIERYVGENDLFLEIFEGEVQAEITDKRPPLLFVHGAYTGGWMWSKYIPHFIKAGWKCYVMNMRGHYKSRAAKLTRVTFEDYMEDIKEIISECYTAPIVIGFSMGGILCQKLAETTDLAGMVLIDSTISREVYEKVPYKHLDTITPEIIRPAPAREERYSIDESEEDIIFQRKYLAMESAKAFNAISFFNDEDAPKGISVNTGLITCHCLVITAVNNNVDEMRGKAAAEQLNAEYTGFLETTHTGLLVGQRYSEVVDRILEWLKDTNIYSL